MRQRIAWVLVSLICALAQAEEYRIFTDEEGRAIEAKVVSYDPVKGAVQIERTDGKRVWVSPGLFSPDDQAYLKEWIAANRVLSDDNLRISFDKKRIDHVKKGMTDEERTSEGVESEIICYEITIRNRSKKAIENLKLEYRYFVETVGDNIPKDTLKNTLPGSLTVARIEPGERVTLTTGNLTLDEKYSKEAVYETQYIGGSRRFIGYEIDKVSEDDLLGIWLKIYGPEVDGEPTVRDVCEPEDLFEDVDWSG